MQRGKSVSVLGYSETTDVGDSPIRKRAMMLQSTSTRQQMLDDLKELEALCEKRVAEMVKKYGFAATLSELVFLAGKHITPVQIGFTVAYEKAEQILRKIRQRNRKRGITHERMAFTAEHL
jgi:hypothetical protein